MPEVPERPRYYVFCESPERLQEFLNTVKYYDLKETFIIPRDSKPIVCVVMEDPSERTRVHLEHIKRQTQQAASQALRATASLLEQLSSRLQPRQVQE